MAQVTVVRTPISAQTVAGAIQSLWSSIVGGSPSKDAVVMLTTQIDLETGWNNCWNWNVGNIAGTAGDYVMLHSSDGTYRPYRAFNSLTDGVNAYLSLLKTRYSSAIASAMSGDLTGFATNLKTSGYYQETLDSYITGMQARYAAVEKAIGSGSVIQPGPSPSPGPSIWATIFGGLALGGAVYLAYETYVLRPVPTRRRRAV